MGEPWSACNPCSQDAETQSCSVKEAWVRNFGVDLGEVCCILKPMEEWSPAEHRINLNRGDGGG